MKLKQIVIIVLLGLLFVGGSAKDGASQANDSRLAAIMDASFMTAHAALNNLPPTPSPTPPKPDGGSGKVTVPDDVEPKRTDSNVAPPQPPPVAPEKVEPSKQTSDQPGPQANKPAASGVYYYKRRSIFGWR